MMRLFPILLLLLTVSLMIQAGTLSFTDITVSAGTGGPTAANATGGHGASWADVDGDSRPDLYITMILNDPMPDLFFRNRGGNVFADEGAARGIDDFDGGSHSGAWADLDNDGDYDLFNGTTWYTAPYLSHNNVYENDGSGYFMDVTPHSLKAREEVTRGVITFDMDKDGDLDLFCVTNYQGSSDPAGEYNEVYRNDGNFVFTAITSGALYTCPAGQGASDTDYDGDGDVDVFAGNRTGDVNVLRNNGSGVFTKITPSSIGINHQAKDAISTADIDNDGDLDLMLSGDNYGYLYLNDGDGTFTYLRSFSSTDGYMASFGDLDNDGDLDLYFAGDNLVYLNNGSGAYSNGPAVPISGINDPRGSGLADIDGDGDLDIAIGVKRSRNWLVRNNYDDGNWLKVKLTAANGQAGAFGAKVYVYPTGSSNQLGLREARSNYGYLGQDDPVLHFGLGAYSSADIKVVFLDGTIKTVSAAAAGQTIAVKGDGGGGAFDKTGTQWSPYMEWALDNPSWSGNAFDLNAAVTFSHSGSGATRTTRMFHDGGTTWKFRFTATRTGTWTFTTSSSDSDLHGKSGTVTVTANPDSDAHGFVKKFGNKWGWEGTEEAFTPQFVMLGGNIGSVPRDFYNNTARIDNLIQEFIDGHGFDGFHVAVVAGYFFDINKANEQVNTSLTEPDPRTFEALEDLITRTHAAGGLVHIWPWGDSSRSQTPRQLTGGINGSIDQRLQRYIAARLGPVPGWTIGYGFDLDEWVSESQIDTWHDYMQNHLGWSHFLGGRPVGPNSGTNHSQFNSWNDGMDYSSYEHHKPSYDVYVAAMSVLTGQPAFSEDRFRVRDEGRSKDYDTDQTRRGLYTSVMAGGCANIWGYLLNSTGIYPNKTEIKTYSVFWRDNRRFLSDMVRDNSRTDGYCLRSAAANTLIFYKENTSSIQIDLTGIGGSRTAVAINTKQAYSEIAMGNLSGGVQTWNAPYSSDWIIAVTDAGGGPSNTPPGVDAGSNQTITLPTDTVNLNGTVTDPDDNPSMVWTKHSGPGTVSFGNAAAVDTTAQFSAAGTYVLKLTADDGTNAPVSDTVTVTVNAAGGGGGVLVNDPLNGSTIGTASGSGIFEPGGGWKSNGGRIVYDAGKHITNGYFEADMSGWTAPAQGTDKSHPLSGWESEGDYGHYLEQGCFWNWRIGTGYNPFKVLATPQALANRVEARVGSNGMVNDGNPHTYRIEWSGGMVRFLLDGSLLQSWSFSGFQLRYFVIGKDMQYGITNPAPVIANVKIVDLDGGGGNTPPTVEAGINQTITLPTDAISLNGTVTDPDDTPSTAWSKQSGPGTVSFGNAAAVDTTAQFSAAGTYVLKLTADDGTNAPVFDTVSITVNPDPGSDADGDGMDDAWEAANGVSDPNADPDGDILTNLQEFQNGTDPKDGDSDGDGLDDGIEITYGLDPNNGGDAGADNDSDGLSNAEEILLGTDLDNADTDGDGLDDLIDPEPLIPDTGGADENTLGTKGGCEPSTAGANAFLICQILLALSLRKDPS